MVTHVCQKPTFRPIFIVGASRSGTTMLNRVLGNHSAVLGLNELHFFGTMWDPYSQPRVLSTEEAIRIGAYLLARIRRGVWGGEADKQDIADAQKLLMAKDNSQWTAPLVFEHVLQEEARINGATHVTEQTGRNLFYAHKLLELYPDARVIHLVRDPRAILFSQKNRWRKNRLGTKVPLTNVLRVFVNYHPFTITKLWKKSAEIAQTLDTNSRYLRLFYENLVSKPDESVRALCQFLGLEFETNMLSVPQVGSSIKAHNMEKLGLSAEFANQWRGRLPRSDIAVCEFLAKDAMHQFGYDFYLKHPHYLSMLGPLIKFPFHAFGAILINPKTVLLYMRSIIRLYRRIL